MEETAVPPKKNFVLPAAVLLIVLLVGAVAFWIYSDQKNSKESPKTSPTSNTSTSSAQGSKEDEALIKESYADYTQTDVKTLVINISQNTGDFAKGIVEEVAGKASGNYFLATKLYGSWVIVYDGQKLPNCDDVNRYNFPEEMVSECVDGKGATISR